MKIINKKEGTICINDSNYQLFEFNIKPSFNEVFVYIGNDRGTQILNTTRKNSELLLKELSNDLFLEGDTAHFIPNRIPKNIIYCNIVFDTMENCFSIMDSEGIDKLGMRITGELIEYLFKKEGYEEVAKWLTKIFLNAKEIFEEISDENKLLSIL